MSCDLIVGPFTQTLFLGASVEKFEMNLAWGADASTCTVTLFEDDKSTIMGYHGRFHRTQIDSEENKPTTPSLLFDDEETFETPPGENTLHRELIKDLSYKYQDQDNITNFYKIGYNVHPGAHQTAINTDSFAKWVSEDPGFIGNSTDILGAAVNFRYENMYFNGLIKNWKKDRQGRITVEIQSPASLLKNTNLILQKYSGSVANWITAPDGRAGMVPSLGGGLIGGSIFHGNAPNIGNVFGLWENFGLGDSGWVAGKGIPANTIYNALLVLFGGQNIDDVNDGTPTADGAYVPQYSIFSTYGGIVAKAPYDPYGKYNIDTHASFYEAEDPEGLNAAYKEIYYDQMGFYATKPDLAGIYRNLFRLDLSEVPAPATDIYINDDQIDVLSFIEFCCEQAGCDFVIGCSPDHISSPFSGRIVASVANRNQQPELNKIRTLIDNIQNDTTGKDKLLDYSYGTEYNESSFKTILSGGKQKRLHQFATHNYGTYRHYRVFEPLLASPADYSSGKMQASFSSSNNVYRAPNTFSQRSDYWRTIGAANYIDSTEFNTIDPSTYPRSFPGGINPQGNYNQMTYPIPPAEVVNYNAGYNLSNDIISPFFGFDTFGNARNVNFDSLTQQLYVSVPGGDVYGIFGSLADGSYSISENEIRAARGGYDTWFVYTLRRFRWGNPSSLGMLAYNYMLSQYGKLAADHMFGFNIVDNQKQYQELINQHNYSYGGGLDDSVTNIDQAAKYTTGFLDTMRSLHAYISGIATYYGRSYMVRIPNLISYSPLRSGATQYVHEITDAAWEEPGNLIDDTMTVGALPEYFKTADGRIEPILGFDNSTERYRSPDIGNSIFINALLRMRDNISSNIYYPLINTAGPYLVMPHYSPHATSTVAGLAVEWAHGGTIPADQRSRLYIKSSIDTGSGIVWHNGSPRVVVTIPGLMYISGSTDISDAMYESMIPKIVNPTPGTNFLQSVYAWLLATSSTPTPSSYAVSLRAAMPIYAAIPMQHNFSTYGPWSTNPGLIHTQIFPGQSDSAARIDTLAGGTKFIVDDTLVPWDFGGMYNLDYAALLILQDSDKYEQSVEYGSLSVADVLIGNLGGVGARLEGGPYVNSLNTSISADGIRTNYTFRTFTQKRGLYNKQLVDNIRSAVQERIELNRKIRSEIGGY